MKQPGIKINIHHILPVSEVNGPGKRGVIWVQGCVFRCKGCFNQDLIPFKQANLMKIPDIMAALWISEIEGVTISGGEPFAQAQSLSLLAKEIVGAGLTLMVYTGYTYDYLLETDDPGVKDFLSYIDILVDGPYKQDFKPNSLWAGSGNQKILFLTNRYANYENEIYQKDRYVEFHITSGGLIKATGFSR
ncbi:MAG: radical SAM protein [Spirochaetales bacterium]|nr:radical SAM protein [Spirochaetales bacterium]